MPAPRHLAALTACVVLLHAAALWALTAGLAREPSPLVVPVTLLAGSTSSQGPSPRTASVPGPATVSDAAAPAPTGPGAIKPAPRELQPAGVVAVTPKTTPSATPSTASSVLTANIPGVARATLSAAETSAPASPAAATAPAAASAAPEGGMGATPSPPSGSISAVAGSPAGSVAGSVGGSGSGPAAAPGRVELPSSDAAYLRNPPPAYPPRSRQFGEQGRVVVRVLVDAEGLPQRAQVHQTSGHTRLDQAALATVLQWRYVPGRRAGVPEAMWLNVPISFVLE